MASVSFSGPSACTPQPHAPCTLNVVAQASSPAGDRLRYLWSGCAAGTAPQAVCTVERPGPVTATVEVTDGRGHTSSASATAEGTNHPPSVQLGYAAKLRDGYLELLGTVVDPDEGSLCGRQYCLRASASGACGPTAGLDCTCLAGLESDVRTDASGTCTVVLSVQDSWGQMGTASFTFDVAHPQP